MVDESEAIVDLHGDDWGGLAGVELDFEDKHFMVETLAQEIQIDLADAEENRKTARKSMVRSSV